MVIGDEVGHNGVDLLWGFLCHLEGFDDESDRFDKTKVSFFFDDGQFDVGRFDDLLLELLPDVFDVLDCFFLECFKLITLLCLAAHVVHELNPCRSWNKIFVILHPFNLVRLVVSLVEQLEMLVPELGKDGG